MQSPWIHATYTATVVVALLAHRANRLDLIGSPKGVLAHLRGGGDQ